MATSKSRRDFLADSAAGLSSVWLAAHWPAILEAEEYAQRTATAAEPVKFAFFTDPQAADIDAMASQIFPTTDTPGAHEAHVVNFQQILGALVCTADSAAHCHREDAVLHDGPRAHAYRNVRQPEAWRQLQQSRVEADRV